ncbi:MAG TPA: metal ABC transporter ATP-binding protein [Polyangia bacterium]|nr:metal ABC transporter ATP-binding protein [Polyangia bacterium]
MLAPGQPLLSADALEVGYDGVAILPPLSVTVGAGEMWAVIGPNGAGKSTYVRTLLGLEKPVAGSVTRAPGLTLAYVPQQGALDGIFPVAVRDFVLMGRQGPGNVLGKWRAADLAAADAALAEAGVAHLARRQLRDLSGGQRQRVLMARALARDADVIVLDEPTAALDLPSERDVLVLVEKLRARRGAAIVMVTHLVEDGLERANRALLLDRDHGVALALPSKQMREHDSFQHVYGRFVARHTHHEDAHDGGAA